MSYSESLRNASESVIDSSILSGCELLAYQNLCSKYKIMYPRPLQKDEIFKVFPVLYSIRHLTNTLDRLNKLRLEFDPALNANILRFVLSLKLYDLKQIRFPSIHTILDNVLRPDYASYLKKVKMYSFIKRVNGSLLEPQTTVLESDLTTDFDSIGQIYHYQWLLWIEEEVTDFEDYSFSPVDSSGEDYFRKCTRRYLKDLPDIELDLGFIKKKILVNIKNSSTYDGPMWYIKQQKNRNIFSKERGISRRTIINVAPGNSRDTIINKLEDLNTISYIEKVLFTILDKLDLDTYTTSEDKFIKKFKALQESNWVFCRDFEKEGLTRPRYINRVILSEINRRWNLDLPEHFFDLFLVEDDKNDLLFPTRGTGLGMANSIVTFMQLIIHDAVLHEISGEIDQDIDLDVNHLTLNDDNIVAFDNEFVRDYYINIELRILKILDLQIKKSKSFYAYKAGVFLERYFYAYSNMDDKKSFELRSPHSFLLGVNPLLSYTRKGVPFLSKAQLFLPKQLCGVATEEKKVDFLLDENDYEELSDDFSALITLKLSDFELKPSKFIKNMDLEKDYNTPYGQVYPGLEEILTEEEKEQFFFCKDKNVFRKFNKERENYKTYYKRINKVSDDLIRKFNKIKSEKKFDMISCFDLKKKLYKTGSYFINPKDAFIVLQKSELQYVIPREADFFWTDFDPVQSLINLRKHGAGLNQVFQNRKERFFYEGEHSFPFPKDRNLFKLFIANYATWTEARDQLDKTGVLPLLGIESCRPYLVERSEFDISDRTFDYILRVGPIPDLGFIRILNDMRDDVYEIIIDLLSENNEDMMDYYDSDSEEDYQELAAKARAIIQSQKALTTNEIPEEVFEIFKEEESISPNDDKEKYSYIINKIRGDLDLTGAYTKDEANEVVSNHVSWLEYYDIEEINEGAILLPDLFAEENDEMVSLIRRELGGSNIGYSTNSLKAKAIAKILKVEQENLISEHNTNQRGLDNIRKELPSMINGVIIDEVEEYRYILDTPDMDVLDQSTLDDLGIDIEIVDISS